MQERVASWRGTYSRHFACFQHFDLLSLRLASLIRFQYPNSNARFSIKRIKERIGIQLEHDTSQTCALTITPQKRRCLVSSECRIYLEFMRKSNRWQIHRYILLKCPRAGSTVFNAKLLTSQANRW